MTLAWPGAVLAGLKPWAEKCYPKEGCGLLLGQFEPEGRKRVRRFVPLANTLVSRGPERPLSSPSLEAIPQDFKNRFEASTGAYEFIIDPAEFNRAVLAGEKESLDVVGVLHTHPDHPAKPSATDAAQPLLSGWANVIVKVDRGRFVEARSWVRDREDQPFEEEAIVTEEGER